MNLSIDIKVPEGFPKPEVRFHESDNDAGIVNTVNDCAKVAPRFVPAPTKSEVVLDTMTGLMWDDAGSDKRMTHKEAEAYVKTLKQGGFTDWRLPTIQELLTLVNYERRDPAIDTSAFACKSEGYWTSTPVAGVSAFAWLVSFYDGSSDWSYRYDSYFVRAVRASQ